MPNPNELLPVVVEKHQDGTVTVTCPHCGSVNIKERETATRWNRPEFGLDTEGNLVVEWAVGEADFENDGYLCVDCFHEVDVLASYQDWV